MTLPAITTLDHVSPEDGISILSEVLRETYKQSLFKTTVNLLGYRELTEETHEPIIHALERDTKRKLIVVPRGCFKSTVCTVAFPIWALLRNPNERILIDSELYSNSSKFLREIKGHLTSPKLTRLYGRFYSASNWNEGEITIAQRTKIYKESSITCSGIGAQKTSQHYTMIIADDMNSPDNSGTPDAREKVIDHYRLYTSLLEPGGTIVVVATRYAEDDLPGWILANEVNRRGLL